MDLHQTASHSSTVAEAVAAVIAGDPTDIAAPAPPPETPPLQPHPTPSPLEMLTYPSLRPHVLTVILLPARDRSADKFRFRFFGNAGLSGPDKFENYFGIVK